MAVTCPFTTLVVVLVNPEPAGVAVGSLGIAPFLNSALSWGIVVI